MTYSSKNMPSLLQTLQDLFKSISRRSLSASPRLFWIIKVWLWSLTHGPQPCETLWRLCFHVSINPPSSPPPVKGYPPSCGSRDESELMPQHILLLQQSRLCSLKRKAASRRPGWSRLCDFIVGSHSLLLSTAPWRFFTVNPHTPRGEVLMSEFKFNLPSWWNINPHRGTALQWKCLFFPVSECQTLELFRCGTPQPWIHSTQTVSRLIHRIT